MYVYNKQYTVICTVWFVMANKLRKFMLHEQYGPATECFHLRT